jgi:DNA-binding CsgD family transcriptional regulator
LINLFEKIAYATFGGDDIASIVVSIILHEKLPAMLKDEKERIISSAEITLNECIYPIKVDDLKIDSGEINTTMLIDNLFDMSQYIIVVICTYYLLNLIYSLIGLEFSIAKKRTIKLATCLFLLIITVVYAIRISEIIIGEYILSGLRLIIYLIIIYCIVILILNLNKVKKEVKKPIIYCLIIIFIFTPLRFLANNVGGLPTFIYKFPYSPVLYFFINSIGVIFVQRNIAYEKNCIDNNKCINMNEVYKVFTKRYGITERELDIVKLIADGYSNPDIGEKLYISLNTVKNHIYNIYRKIGIKNRYELISILSQIQKPE